MPRVIFCFEHAPLLGAKEVVEVPDTDILIYLSDKKFRIPIKDIKSISSIGADSILIGYGVNDDRTLYYRIKAVHSQQVVLDQLLSLVKKNKVDFRPVSIGCF